MIEDPLGTAHCPACLIVMDVLGEADDGSDAHLQCPSCGLVALIDG